MMLLVALADAQQVAGPDFTPPIGRAMAALAFVLVLLVGLAWLLRKGVLARRQSDQLGVETALSLGDRRSLVVVTVEGRRLLLGLTPGQVSLVTELRPTPASFEQAITRATAAQERSA